jgi:hypothetical protein
MFNQYISRDKAKRGRPHIGRRFAWSLVGYRRPQYLPTFEDEGIDSDMFIRIEELRGLWANRHALETLTPKELKQYTIPIPFCTVPIGGTDPKKKQGGRMRNPFRKPTEVAAEKSLVAAFTAEMKKNMSDDLPPVPTFEEQLVKAGGKTCAMPAANDLVAWHEQDPT